MAIFEKNWHGDWHLLTLDDARTSSPIICSDNNAHFVTGRMGEWAIEGFSNGLEVTIIKTVELGAEFRSISKFH